MERLKELSKSDPPKMAFFKSIKEKGTTSEFKNVADHPRNVQRVKNIKRNSQEKPEDPMLELIEMLRQGERDPRKRFLT